MKQELANSPLVKLLVKRILVANNSIEFSSLDKKMINPELVPKLSQKVFTKGFLGQGRVSPINQLAQPIKRPLRPMQPVVPVQPIIRPATTADYLEMPEGYGKLQPLLVDQTVTSIECPGSDKPITIFRAGQILQTRITMSQEEVSSLLKKISQKAKIPLIEGVFRAAVDNFTINAVVSDMIGSKFIIKKQTPYSLLEGGGR